MSVTVANSRFIDFSLREFYQHLFRVSGFQELGQRLVREAEMAQALRQVNKLEEIAPILSVFPIKEYRLIGNYYQAWLKRRDNNARYIFETVLEQSRTYKAKALISLAAIESYQQDHNAELCYFTEALKVTDSPSLVVEASRAIAVVKAKEGFHKQAITDLERIYPLVRCAAPNFYYQYLNSYAVELAEVERIEEAQNVCRITLASPYAFAYPEWRETGQDLALRGYKSRSSVRVKLPGNLLYMPDPVASEASDTCIQSELSKSAPVVSLEEWKEQKMVKEPNGDNDNPDTMTEQEMVMKLIEMLTTGEGDEKKIRILLKAALKIFYGK